MMKIEINGQYAEVYTPYDKDFIYKIKTRIGGARWDAAKKCWSIPVDAVDSCRDIMQECFGMSDVDDNGDTVTVKVSIVDDISELQSSVRLFGKVLSRAYGRDSSGKPGEDVLYIEGAPQSGGSVKNWRSIVPKGSVIMLTNVKRKLWDNYVDSNKSDLSYVAELVEATINKGQLRAEKERLLQRIQEINKLLGE